MITAKLQGRRLVLTVETEEDEQPITPFKVDPLPGKIGRTLSARYLFVLEDLPLEEGSIGEDMITCLGQENYDRLDDEVSADEGQLLMQAAYFWQLVTGMEGTRALLAGQEDGTGLGKAIGLFREKQAPLRSQIQRNLELALRTQTGDTPVTSSHPGGEPNVKPPTDSFGLPKKTAAKPRAKKPPSPSTPTTD